MRILFITWNYPPKVGGMEKLLSQLVQSLHPYAEVQVIGPYADPSYSDADHEEIARPNREGLAWFALHALQKGFRSLRSRTYDVILGGSALVTPIVQVLGWIFRIPSVVYVHGLDLIYSHPVYQWMIRLLLPRCDAVFANSRASKLEAVHRGVSPDRIAVLHPGLDFAEFETVPDVASVRQKHDLNGRPTLLSVGRLAKRKGLVEFVKYSLPAILEKHPDAVFLVVGGNPSMSLTHKEDIKSQVEAEAARLGLESHVRLLGWIDREDLIDLYHACDVFVLPAIHVRGDMEGFGIVLIEASAAGKPVVSTRLGGITDAVVDGKSGILLEAERWDAISDAVSTLLANESLCQDMGQFGRERIRSELHWPVIARRYVDQLEVLIEASHG